MGGQAEVQDTMAAEDRRGVGVICADQEVAGRH